jgi:diguanylate cyclase (GGDEF)-like protein
MGDQIPVTARILAVADCFDAMQEDRQYRKALTRAEAIKLLREGAGTIFDPEITRAFLDHISEFEAEIRQQGVDRQTGRLRFERPAVRNRLAESKETAVERIRAGHREVLTLYDIAEAIGDKLDLRDVFALVSARLQEIVSYSTCILYVFNHETNQVEARLASGRNAELFKQRRMSPGEGVAGWVVAHRHPMHNSDPKLDFDALKVEVRDTYRTGAVVPLLNDNDVLGALAVYSSNVGAYEPDHLPLLEAVAKVLTDAVANSRSREATRTTALGDQLTGLPNARALRHRFDEQVDRAKRHRDNFSVVMIDIDGFKGINDQLGHQTGDHLLKAIARLLYNQVESSDFVSRYGGDEFVLILQIPTDQAPDVVRRLQRIVETYDFRLKTPNTFSGISAGWACFGLDGTTLDELLLTADRRMHTDKARRRGLISETGALRTSEIGILNVM